MAQKKYGTAACVLITDSDGNVLVVSRKNNPEKIGIPGGKREEWETYEEAAIRECSEETGLVITNLKKVYEGPCANDAANDEYHTVTFIADISGNPVSDISGNPVSPEGLIVNWAPWSELMNEKLSPFSSYNKKLYDAACPVIVDVTDATAEAS